MPTYDFRATSAPQDLVAAMGLSPGQYKNVDRCSKTSRSLAEGKLECAGGGGVGHPPCAERVPSCNCGCRACLGVVLR